MVNTESESPLSRREEITAAATPCYRGEVIVAEVIVAKVIVATERTCCRGNTKAGLTSAGFGQGRLTALRQLRIHSF